MRMGAAPALFLLAVAGALPALSAPPRAEGTGTPPGRSPRGPYLLRQIFGDLPRQAPEIWGVAPGIQLKDVPGKTDMGEEERRPDAPTVFTRDVSGRATVSFVFAGDGPEARLDHITVTVVEAPNITPKAVLSHLTRTYGATDPLPERDREEILGSWMRGAVLLRHFSAARFFEVTLSFVGDDSAATP